MAFVMTLNSVESDVAINDGELNVGIVPLFFIIRQSGLLANPHFLDDNRSLRNFVYFTVITFFSRAGFTHSHDNQIVSNRTSANF